MIFSYFLNINSTTFFPFLFNNIFYNNYWFFNKNFNTAKKHKNVFLFFKYTDLIKTLFLIVSWLKIRVLYYTNNWVYTTNHKRIAVNYFWFVILAGIVGMVLATVIRLELAYPGVGIFAGDSLQYLSLVSAHGVIMVFFMIMPLLFGAFANFLLPTQLGVHDVAFPRLNSAAFWFLPAGLIMLAQLVCVDRRYQRMNCFNIREIQSILKRRFFTDLINTNDHHDFLNETMMGVRFKTNSLNSINPNMFVFNNYGIEFATKSRLSSYTKEFVLNTSEFSPKSVNFFLINYLNNNAVFNLFNNAYISTFSDLNVSLHGSFLFKNFIINSFIFYFSFFNYTGTLSSFIFEKISNFDVSYYYDCLSRQQLYYLMFSTYDSVNLILYGIWKVANFVFFQFYELFMFFIGAISQVYLMWLNYKNTNSSLSWTSIQFFNVKNLQFSTTFIKINLYEFFHIFSNVEIICLQNRPTFAFPNFRDIFFMFFAIFENIDSSFYDEQLKLFVFYDHIDFSAWYNKIVSYLNSRFGIDLNFAPYTFDEISTFFSELRNFATKVNYYEIYFYSNNNFFFLPNNNDVSLEKSFFNMSHKDFYISPLQSVTKLNYDSYYVYLYIFFYHITFLPRYVFNAIYGIWKPVNISRLMDSFNDLFSSWYFPLMVSDNVFFSLWKKFHNYMLLENNFKSFVFFQNLYLFVFNYCIYIYKSIQFNLSQIKNISDLLNCLHIFIYNIQGLLADFLLNLVTFLSLFVFSYKTVFIFDFFYFTQQAIWNNNFFIFNKKQTPLYSSSYFSTLDSLTQFKLSNEETSLTSNRYHKFDNPLFKYDYKSGDYFPKPVKDAFTYLFTTMLDLTGGLRSAPWFYSESYLEFFDANFSTFCANITTNFDTYANLHKRDSTQFLATDAFYNFFFTLSTDNLFINKRWVALNALNQKFYRMFNTSSMQQRIYSNWKQLKFTREAWRCKLLSARHQKTLYKRYANEDGVFWSIERNARDLIPGWAMITPFSSRTRYTAIGKTDIGLMGVLLVLNSSIISAANFLVTYRYLSTLNNRKMRDARSFFTEGIMVSSWMMIFANPMLVIGIIMLLSDRHWQTSFFDYSGGGDTVLFQHMFWFFGHPEVYIIVIPTFGFTNTILSYYLKKRISARASLMYSMYTIAFLGFFVWGHHMYMVGLAHTTRMLFSTLTVMISVPAATKLMHWCVTLANSSLSLELPMICILTFVFFFVSGGISGMYVANTGMDILFHDTFYVIGHFHVMLAGAAMIGSFGAFYFYFIAIFGIKYSRIYAYLHYIYYFLGQLFTVIPMFWLGYAGMPRRILDYPAAFGGWHSVISGGHMLSVAGLIAFFIMIFDSLRQAKAATRNTFGIGRYNTRLNFYIYEIARLIYVQQKSWAFFKFNQPRSLKLNGLNYANFEHLETTLFSYTFYKID